MPTANVGEASPTTRSPCRITTAKLAPHATVQTRLSDVCFVITVLMLKATGTKVCTETITKERITITVFGVTHEDHHLTT